MTSRVVVSLLLCIAVAVVMLRNPEPEPVADADLDAMWDRFEASVDVYTADLAALHYQLVQIERNEIAFRRGKEPTTSYLISRKDFR